MDEHDLKKDGVISYYEFKALFLDLKDMEDAKRGQLELVAGSSQERYMSQL